eukprot:2770649-Pyramimonas_sp.AAC.1
MLDAEGRICEGWRPVGQIHGDSIAASGVADGRRSGPNVGQGREWRDRVLSHLHAPIASLRRTELPSEVASGRVVGRKCTCTSHRPYGRWS